VNYALLIALAAAAVLLVDRRRLVLQIQTLKESLAGAGAGLRDERQAHANTITRLQEHNKLLRAELEKLRKERIAHATPASALAAVNELGSVLPAPREIDDSMSPSRSTRDLPLPGRRTT